eukprot:GHVL01037741.1.p2 GENE.GHVL01037741.1~~GHVL01037741.1.p2  ORF type:complete len:181 (-),score=27.71 GHVL01037741.1:59-601(-)
MQGGHAFRVAQPARAQVVVGVVQQCEQHQAVLLGDSGGDLDEVLVVVDEVIVAVDPAVVDDVFSAFMDEGFAVDPVFCAIKMLVQRVSLWVVFARAREVLVKTLSWRVARAGPGVEEKEVTHGNHPGDHQQRVHVDPSSHDCCPLFLSGPVPNGKNNQGKKDADTIQLRRTKLKKTPKIA